MPSPTDTDPPRDPAPAAPRRRRRSPLVAAALLLLLLLPLAMPATLLNIDAVRLHLLPLAARQVGITLAYRPIERFSWQEGFALPQLTLKLGGIRLELHRIDYQRATRRLIIGEAGLRLPAPERLGGGMAGRTTAGGWGAPPWLERIVRTVLVRRLRVTGPALQARGRLRLDLSARRGASISLRINRWRVPQLPFDGTAGLHAVIDPDEASVTLDTIRITTPPATLRGRLTILSGAPPTGTLRLHYRIDRHTTPALPPTMARRLAVVAARGGLDLRLRATADGRIGWSAEGRQMLDPAEGSPLPWRLTLDGTLQPDGTALALHRGRIETPFATLELAGLARPAARLLALTATLSWETARMPPRWRSAQPLSGRLGAEVRFERNRLTADLDRIALHLPEAAVRLRADGRLTARPADRTATLRLAHLAVDGAAPFPWHDEGAARIAVAWHGQRPTVTLQARRRLTLRPPSHSPLRLNSDSHWTIEQRAPQRLRWKVAGTVTPQGLPAPLDGGSIDLYAEGAVARSLLALHRLSLTLPGAFSLECDGARLPWQADRPLTARGSLTLPDLLAWRRLLPATAEIASDGRPLTATLSWGLKRNAAFWRIDGNLTLHGGALRLGAATLDGIALRLPLHQRLPRNRPLLPLAKAPPPPLAALLGRSSAPPRHGGRLAVRGVRLRGAALGDFEAAVAWRDGHLTLMPKGAAPLGGRHGGVIDCALSERAGGPAGRLARCVGRYTLIDADLAEVHPDRHGRFSLFASAELAEGRLRGRISLPEIGSGVPLLLIDRLDRHGANPELQQARRMIELLHYVPRRIDAALDGGFVDLDLRLQKPASGGGIDIPLHNIAIGRFLPE